MPPPSLGCGARRSGAWSQAAGVLFYMSSLASSRFSQASVCFSNAVSLLQRATPSTHNCFLLKPRALRNRSRDMEHAWVAKPQVDIDLHVLDVRQTRQDDQLQAQLHAIRAQRAYEDFLRSGRHEAEDMSRNRSLFEMRRRFGCINQKATREALGYGPGHRAVLLASVVSDAWLCSGQRDSQACSLCGAEVGSFTHIAECPYFGTALEIPGCPITARLGWLRVGSLAQDRAWLAS